MKVRLPALRVSLVSAAVLFATAVCAAQPATAAAARPPVPPRDHPRLYLRPEHVAQLPARLKDPVLQPAIERLQRMARSTPQYRVEWEALQYLASPDPKRGRAIVEETLALLKKSELPDRQDACRITGRMMVTGAIVYDWLYPLLIADEKKAYITELIRLAKTQECGYPPKGQGSVTGHSSEAMIMRDMISAGIAIHDEYPEMYDLAAGRFFAEHLPARNWLYNGHAYHQGDSYGVHRYHWDTFPLFIFDRLGAGNVYNPEQRFVPYLWIYTTRPDGQRLRAGDTFASSAPRGRPWSEYVGTLLTASYYKDGVLLSHFLKHGGASDTEQIFEVLWRDTTLQPKPIEALPLSRYFGHPFGWMVARTGWGEDAVIAEMKINEYNFVNHQHLDAGAFQIYARGPLAIDSGLYSGSSGAYGSPHTRHYYWRTIAHNSLLIHDPAEKFHSRGDYGNDGGQRLPNNRSEARNLDMLLDPQRGYRTGQVLAHGFGPSAQTPDYTLLQGDITQAYSAKVRAVTRSFVFLNLRNAKVPAALIVLDRVVSSDPAFRKFWLLHSMEQPQIDGMSATVDRTEHGESGRLTLDVLLPAATNAELSKIGGPGKEFWVFGQNHTNDVPPERLARSSMEAGAWRVELSPRQAAAEDLFFTVMQTTDRRTPTRWPVRRIDAGERVGCSLTGDGGTWLVLLRKDNQRSANPVDVELAGTSRGRVLVTDLAPGRWRAQRSGSNEAVSFDVTKESGAGWFEGAPGAWKIARIAGGQAD